MSEINFNFTNDPLLNSRTDFGAQYRELERLEQVVAQRKEALRQLRNSTELQQSQQQVSQTPVWDEIDRITQAMSDKEFEIVASNDEFVESQNRLTALINAKYMQMMRPIVEQCQEGKDILDNHLTLVKRLKKSATKVVDEELNDFKEYKEKYSKMSYEDYQAMKRGN